MAPQNALEALPQEPDLALCQGTHEGLLQLRLEGPHLLLMMMYMCKSDWMCQNCQSPM